MTSKEIQQLISFISKSGMDEVKIETEEFKLSVKKNSPSIIHTSGPLPSGSVSPVQNIVPVTVPPATMGNENTPQAPPEEKPAAGGKFVEIKAPMIGTFYRSPDPDSEPFLKVGDTVKKGDAVCIIEAMKLFNEIESDKEGKVVKILVDDASPVEYDQPLFLLELA